MAKVEFIHDRERDIRNVWETANFDHPWENSLPKSSGLHQWKNRSYEECREEIQEDIQRFHNSKVLPIFLKSLEDSWKLINDAYFNRLKKVTEGKIYTDQFTAYLTIAGRCPYFAEDDSFMVSSRRPIFQNLRTCGHELLHLQMEKTHLPYIREQLKFREAEYVNESLTSLLNLEFKDLWLVHDFGYDEHRGLRKIIAEKWKSNPQIKPLINDCIDHVKNNRNELTFLDV